VIENGNLGIDQEIPWRQLYDYLILQKNMVKSLLTSVLLLYFSSSFSQWQEWSSYLLLISSAFTKRTVFFMPGEKNIIYISGDKGQSWDSTTVIPRSFEVDKIIVYKK
jgi:hypothetical protein